MKRGVNIFVCLLVILFIAPFAGSEQVILTDIEEMPEKEILDTVNLYSTRTISFDTLVVWRDQTLPDHLSFFSGSNLMWSDLAMARGVELSLPQDALIRGALASADFTEYCTMRGENISTLSWDSFKNLGSSYNHFLSENVSKGIVQPVGLTKVEYFANTELFSELPGGLVLLNGPLARKLLSARKPFQMMESQAFKYFDSMIGDYPRLFDKLKINVGKLSIGRTEVIPLKLCKKYLRAKKDIEMPPWLGINSDLYLLVLPFTIHPAERPERFKYEYIYFQVNLKDKEHVAYELYPIAVTKESPPVRIESTIEPQIKKGQIIASMGKLFHIELIYIDLKPIITSYGVGENNFYWRLEGEALKMKRWRKMYALIQVPKREKTITGTINIRGRVAYIKHGLLEKLEKYLPTTQSIDRSSHEKMLEILIEADIVKFISSDREINLNLELPRDS